MKVLFSVTDNKIKYNSISISGYRKKDLIKIFEKTLLAGDNYGSLYFGSEIIMSGYYNDFWKICLTFAIEYVHVLLPRIPIVVYENYMKFKNIESHYRKLIKKDNTKTLLDLRNSIVVQSLTMRTIKILQSAKKQHISSYIPKTYNDQVKIIINDIRNAQNFLSMFNKVLSIIISNKIKNLGNPHKIISALFGIIGKILSIDCDSVSNIDNNYNIVLYTHSRSKINERLMKLLWKIILKNSKFDKDILKVIITLIKIYELHILQKTEKQSYIILCIMLYFIYAINFQLPPMPELENADMHKVNTFYNNVQWAISNDDRRKDFIEIGNSNNKIKKKSNNKIKNRTNNVIPPQIPNNIISSNNIGGETMKINQINSLPMVQNVSYNKDNQFSHVKFLDIKKEILESIDEVEDDYFIKSNLLSLMDNARESIEGIVITKTKDNDFDKEEKEREINQKMAEMKDDAFFNIEWDNFEVQQLIQNEHSPDNHNDNHFKSINLSHNNILADTVSNPLIVRDMKIHKH